tara:strand:+ start:1614 stop:2459 length:846 start_codon:yes stop_codon:yes gene_type:complete
MKTPYLYFGRKGYYAQAGVAPTSNVAALTAITNANGGMLPIVKANTVDPATLGYRVVHKAVDAVDDKRGTDYTHDFVSGVAFNDATAWSAAKNADDIQAGQVTNLTSVSAYIVGSGDQVVTVGDNVAAGTAGTVATGITMTANDTVWVEEHAFNAAVLPIATIGADLCVPSTSLIGIEPLAYTAGAGANAGTHYDGTSLDKTRLIFKSGDADRTVDTVDIVHTGDKFKEMCEAMEALMNSTVYDEMVKVHYLDANGQKTHNAIRSRGITIYGVTITLQNRA